MRRVLSAFVLSSDASYVVEGISGVQIAVRWLLRSCDGRSDESRERSLSGEKSVPGFWLHICQLEELARFRDVRSKPDQEKVAPPEKDEFQEITERL